MSIQGEIFHSGRHPYTKLLLEAAEIEEGGFIVDSSSSLCQPGYSTDPHGALHTAVGSR